MSDTENPRVTRGSGNIFADLGLPNADKLLEEAYRRAGMIDENRKQELVEALWVAPFISADESLRRCREAADEIKQLERDVVFWKTHCREAANEITRLERDVIFWKTRWKDTGEQANYEIERLKNKGSSDGLR